MLVEEQMKKAPSEALSALHKELLYRYDFNNRGVWGLAVGDLHMRGSTGNERGFLPYQRLHFSRLCSFKS